MNKKIINMNKIFVIILSAILFLITDVNAQTVKSMGSLTFNITGFADNTGQVIVQLFRKVDEVPSSPFKKVKGVIKNNTAEVIFTNLSYGDYAAIIFHDQNSNGEIDHCWGVPCEPLGYTNDWELSLFSGMPTFEKLKFTFSPTKDNCLIIVK